MERAVECFVAVTSLAVGLSHLLQPRDWAEAFLQLHRCGRPGAFAYGGMNLAVGAAIVSGHGSWAGPGAVLTGLGWLLVAKGTLGLVAPDLSLRSMARGAGAPRGFVVAGLLALALAAWACRCLASRPAAALSRGGGPRIMGAEDAMLTANPSAPTAPVAPRPSRVTRS